jgi:NAD(P)-dependent dehydrogenase (short-subunit alcohol dehydrogenase family)
LNSPRHACFYLTRRDAGFGLVQALADRKDTIVFAGARNPSAATGLLELEKAKSNVHVVKLTSSDEADNAAAVAHIKSVAGALHVVIANAAIVGDMNWPLEVSAASMREALDVCPFQLRAILHSS